MPLIERHSYNSLLYDVRWILNLHKLLCRRVKHAQKVTCSGTWCAVACCCDLTGFLCFEWNTNQTARPVLTNVKCRKGTDSVTYKWYATMWIHSHLYFLTQTLRRVQISAAHSVFLKGLFSLAVQHSWNHFTAVCVQPPLCFIDDQLKQSASVCIPCAWVHSGRLQRSVFSLHAAGGVSLQTAQQRVTKWWKWPIKSRL